MAANNHNGCHWVDELFPPTFNLNSSFDFDQITPNRKDRGAVQKIYEDVYLSSITAEVEKPETSQRTDASLFPVSAEKKFGVKREKDSQEKTLKNDKTTYNKNGMKQATSGIKCLWTSKELGALRKSLERSRLNNIRLCVLTRSLQQDCERLKNNCEEQAREILTYGEKYNNMKKQNIRMKIVCKALKEDIKRHRTDLEEKGGLLREAVTDKEKCEMELLQVNKELEYIRKKCKKISLELENHKLLHNELLKNERDTLQVVHAKELYELSKKLKQTKSELENERNEHSVNKKALANLRLHFASSTTQPK